MNKQQDYGTRLLLQKIANDVAEHVVDHSEKLTVIFSNKKQLKIKGWFMGFQDMFVELAANKEFNCTDLRVLLHLFSQCEFENYVIITQTAISKALRTPQPKVSISIKKLVETGYIQKRKAGANNTYRINEKLIWKGKLENRKKILPFPNN